MDNNELIDYLKSKGMSNETIARVLFYCKKNDNVDYTNKIKFVFDILNYAGVSDEQMEFILNKNTAIIDRSNGEIIKIAAVLYNTNMIDEIFSKERAGNKFFRYKRIFMRNIIAERSGRYGKSLSPNILICEDSIAYGSKYNFYEDIFRVLNARVDTDEELESILNKYLMFNGEHVTVDEYINKLAVIFFNKYKKKEIKTK